MSETARGRRRRRRRVCRILVYLTMHIETVRGRRRRRRRRRERGVLDHMEPVPGPGVHENWGEYFDRIEKLDRKPMDWLPLYG